MLLVVLYSVATSCCLAKNWSNDGVYPCNIGVHCGYSCNRLKKNGVYVHVHNNGLSCCIAAYENERWNVAGGAVIF
ncbi:hypothetical protein GMA19_00455 [Paenibacillus polymyxa E681]|nr:hypothetical protein GE561_00456 [Paenibacillus polymyxa E681]QNV60143.1 hypothetical protein GMA19_00455 [Paenibacillus polymyxa E681]